MDGHTFSRRDALVVGGTALAGLAIPAYAGASSSWPTKRGDINVIRRQHAVYADLLEASIRVGDPLADAVVAELAALGPPGEQALDTGLRIGLASVGSPPPAIAAFLKDAENVPGWASPSNLDRGSDTFLSVPLLAHSLVLSAKSLVHTYSSPAAAKLLVETDKLIYTAKRRLLETAVWELHTMLPGGLTPGADGYVSTLRVRLLHAQMRAAALKRGWDADVHGVPINQVDQARTMLDFTYLPYQGLVKLGYDFTRDEIEAMYTRWRRVGQLLGVSPAFLKELTGHESAAKLLPAVDAADSPPDENSKVLVKATLEAARQIVAWDKFPPESLVDPVNAATRFINEPAVADFYDIPKTNASDPLIYGAPILVRSHRAVLRKVPGAWAEQIKQTTKDAHEFLTAMPESQFQKSYSKPA